jgi:alkanesulfonate monooxygenase SsuD/methylene tetrahydromethanopterin reductase-like flavin-dependent oxidoreductase (luciferase family)
MQFGISIPNGFTDIRFLGDVAQEAEASGWDGFFLWDHINTFPYETMDPWVTLSAIATSTSRIRIGTMVTPLARRRPWIVARQTMTLDHLSGGRVILGVGLGYPPGKEFADLGEDPDERVRAEKLDESLAIIEGLWSAEPFSFEGKHHRINDAKFTPPPVQRPRIPIWVAGMWPTRAPFRRAARWDGVFPMKADLSAVTPDDVREIASFVSQHRAGGGAFDFALGAELPQGDRDVRDAARAASREHIAPYETAGVTWWIEGAYDRAELRSVASGGPPIGAN